MFKTWILARSRAFLTSFLSTINFSGEKIALCFSIMVNVFKVLHHVTCVQDKTISNMIFFETFLKFLCENVVKKSNIRYPYY